MALVILRMFAAASALEGGGGLHSTPSQSSTWHYTQRAAERQLRSDVLDFILDYGTATRARGATHMTLVERALPVELREAPLTAKARGWILVLTDDGALMTCYRRFDASRFLRKKTKRRLSRRQLAYAASVEAFHAR